MKNEYCDLHITLVQDIAEIKGDVKWLVENSKRLNGNVIKHIDESDEYRVKIIKNSSARAHIEKWLLGLYALWACLAGVVGWVIKNHLGK